MKILYTEKIGPATVTIGNLADMWIVSLKDGNIDRQRRFTATAYDDDPYCRALKCYDDSCNAAARIHNTTRPTPPPPDFANVLNV